MIHLIGRAADALLLIWIVARLLHLSRPDYRAAYRVRRGLWPYVAPLAVLYLVTVLVRHTVNVLDVLLLVAVITGWAADRRWYASGNGPDDRDDEDHDDDQDDDPGDDEDDPDDDDDDGDGETWTDRARRIVGNLTGAGPRLRILPADA